MTEFNAQGRTVSGSMRLAAFKRYLANNPAPIFEQSTYRGVEICGRRGRWFVAQDPRVFRSRRAAQAAVDVCLALRAELGEAPQGAEVGR